MARKKPVAPKRAYTKGGQPLTAADLRVLEKAIDTASQWDTEDETFVARQALRNVRELRNWLVREDLLRLFP